MAILRLFIPDDKLTDFVKAVCFKYNYQEFVLAPGGIGPPVPNPESKRDFAKRMIAAHLKNIYIEYKSTIDIAALTKAAADSATAGIAAVTVEE